MNAAHALQATLTPTGNDPIVTVNLGEASILASPLVTMLLAQAIAPDPTNGTLYQQAKEILLGEFRTPIETRVRQTLIERATVVLAPAPTLPSSSSDATNMIAGSRFVMLFRSINLCYATRTGSRMGGGSTAAITTTNLVRSTSTGAPVDAMAICCSNAFILRDIVRDGLTVQPPGGFGIPLQAFETTHRLLLMDHCSRRYRVDRLPESQA
jgi:hypothetical protein